MGRHAELTPCISWSKEEPTPPSIDPGNN